MKYTKSIITNDMRVCYLCGKSENIEIHHIFSGSNRKKSTAFGCVVPLCHECHQGTDGVHFNREKMDYLRKVAQLCCEHEYHWTEQDFRSVFHRNYLDDEDRQKLKDKVLQTIDLGEEI